MKELDVRLGSEVEHDQDMIRPAKLNVHSSHQSPHERFIPREQACLSVGQGWADYDGE